MSVQPTGRLEKRDGTDHLVLERTFEAPIEDVWAAVTEPSRLERWIGTYSGDPATGAVVEQIVDVDTVGHSDFADLPTGWATPTGGGAHLVTTFAVDSQGRTVKETIPLHAHVSSPIPYGCGVV